MVDRSPWGGPPCSFMIGLEKMCTFYFSHKPKYFFAKIFLAIGKSILQFLPRVRECQKNEVGVIN